MEVYYVVSSTHWDREWYRTFQDFRIRLCDVIDKVLEQLDQDPDFKCFTFDGQTIVLEDYLEIYPEKEEIIRKYVEEGRISVGPWYVIPDEFIPSGESTIRNLLIGDEIAQKFGAKLMSGYLPDNFGHTSQMPQILRNFHIDNALFFRGIDKEISGRSEFYWEAPDGSKVLSEHLIAGYWNLKSWGHLGMDVVTHFKQVRDKLKQFASTRLFLLINGSDHLYHDPEMPNNIKEVQKALPDIKIINGSIQDFMEGIKREVDPNAIRVVKGELRYGKDASVLPSVESTRHYVKQSNHECEAELEKYTEPLNAFLYTLGETYPQNFIKHSWKEMIKNHPHDSICGASTDAVMEDVMMRYKHSYEISSRLSDLALEKLVQKITTKDLQDGQKVLAVYNPLTWSRTEIIEATISFPLKDAVKDIKIYDSNDQEVPYELIDIYEEVELQEFKYISKEKHPMKYFKVKFMAKDVIPFGYKSYKIQSNKLRDKRKYQQYQLLYNYNQRIENESYSIAPNPDGSVSIYDKKNKLTYPKLNVFEDRGDCGDEYQYAAPFREEAHYPILKSVSVSHNTPLQSTLKLELELNLPRSLDAAYIRREEDRVSCPITTYITLSQGSNRIEFKTVVENNAKDHILCVKFPTDIRSDYDYSHVAFDVVKRNVDIDLVMDHDNEILTSFKPVQLFVHINDPNKALTLINRGIYEYQVKRSSEGLDVLLTLIRSVGWLFRDVLPSSRDGQSNTTPIVSAPAGQCLGTQVFEYSLVLHKNDVVQDKVYKQAYEFNYPLRAVIGEKGDGNLPREMSWLNITDDRIILSALKKGDKDNSIIVRLYNISEDTVDFKLQPGIAVSKMFRSNMLEENVEELVLGENKDVSIQTGKKEIVTLKIISQE